MKNLSKKTMAMILTAAICVSTLSGCMGNKLVTEDVTKFPLLSIMNEAELQEYYKEAMAFDTVAMRDPEVQETTYETRSVSPKMEARLSELVMNVEEALGAKEFDYDEPEPIVTAEIFTYIKTFLDDKTLTKDRIMSYSEALGFYFVDVSYNLKERSAGNFTDKSVFLGLNGAFRKRADDNQDYIDTAFMARASLIMNEYYVRNRIHKFMKFDRDNLGVELLNENLELAELERYREEMLAVVQEDGDRDEFAAAMSQALDGQTIEQGAVTDTTPDQAARTEPDETGESDGDGASDVAGVNQGASGISSEAYGYGMALIPRTDKDEGLVVVPAFEITTRTPQLDVKLINQEVGLSTAQSAYIPRLSLIYNIPEAAGAGTISGYGIYPNGEFGLGAFGFSRAAMKGTVHMRYVFKEDVENPQDLVLVNVYPVEMELTSGINPQTESPNVPAFVKTELDKVVERFDRARLNNDITALMSTKLVNNIGIPVLVGHEGQYVNVTRQISTIRRVISRTNNNNDYLIEVESIRQEGAKGTNSIGVYRDRYYMVIAQEGTEFKLKDYAMTSRILTKEPALNIDSTRIKRLVALNLAGEVTEEAKADIWEVINGLYAAGTNRKMNGPWNLNDGTEVKLGINDCFNDDTALMSTSQKGYVVSQLQGQLVRYGSAVAAQYRGVAVEWIGAADRQAELVTEEIITYQGRDEAMYMQVYYLLSNMNDEWKIDERTILVSEIVQGPERTNKVNSIDGTQN